MDNFILSLNVVLPLFFAMSVGYFISYLKLIDTPTVDRMNKVSFRVFLPALLFSNIYATSLEEAFNPGLLLFAVGSILILFIFLCFFIPLIEKDNRKRGVMVQGIFRSNFVILGLPIAISLFGNEQAGMTAIVIAVIVPLFNVLAVISLEIYRNKKIDLREIAKGIATNPLIIASLTGLILLIGDIPLPSSVVRTVNDFASVATPLSLVLLGASFKFSEIHSCLKQLLICVLGKLVFVPLVFLSAAIWFGFRDMALVTLMAMFSAPTAISSFTMAQQMEGDSILAGQTVVFTSAGSILTFFIWVFSLKSLGFI